MKKIREGQAGEMTAQIFKQMFPDKPELILLDFLRSDQTELIIIKKLSEMDVMVSRLTKDYVKDMLKGLIK